MIVTAVERQPRRRRVHVFVDGQFVLALGERLATKHGVLPGRELSAAEILALKEAEARRSALESAVRLLSYRPRSERELSDRLGRKGFARPAIDAALERLRELGYVDDAAFARSWTESRQARLPRSRRYGGIGVLSRSMPSGGPKVSFTWSQIMGATFWNVKSSNAPSVRSAHRTGSRSRITSSSSRAPGRMRGNRVGFRRPVRK